MSLHPHVIRSLDLVTSFKSSWLQSGFVTPAEESEQIHLLESLLDTYSELHQFPKLLSKLFLAIEEVIIETSGGVLFNQAFIHVRILEKFVKCVGSLPVGQTFDVWKLFTEVYFQFLTKPSPGHSIQAGAFIVAQLFSAFLLHSQLFEDSVFPIVHSRIKVYLEQTQKSLEEYGPVIFRLHEMEPVPLQLSLLMVLHGYRETRLAYDVAAEAVSIDCLGLIDPCCGFTFLPSHFDGDCDLSSTFVSFLHERDRRYAYLMFKLLAQKLKEWSIQGSDDKNFKTAVTLLLSPISLSSDVSTDWDFNVNTVNDGNYGVALWVEFLQHLPYLTPTINRKELNTLCSCFIDILCQEEQVYQEFHTTTKAAVMKFIRSSFFSESKDFQTAFMTAIWKHATNFLCSKKRMAQQQDEDMLCYAESIFRELSSSTRKWAKHGESTPISKNDNGSSMWDTVQASCDILNEGLNDMTHFPCKLKAKETLKFLKIMNYLPLEYLIPGNQMRCLIGSSAIFCLLGNSCNDSEGEVQELLDELCKVMIAVMEGVRSIWLFDYVAVSSYMKSMVRVLKKLQKMQKDQSDNLLWPEKLLSCLIGIATRSVKTLLAVEDFLLEITSEIADSAPSAMAFLCVFHRLVQMLQRSYLNPDLKKNCERVTAYLCSNIAKCIKHRRRYEVNIYTVLVRCYAELMTLISSPNCSFDADQKVKWLKYLPRVTDVALEAIEKADSTTETETFIGFIIKIMASKEELSSYMSDDLCHRSWKTLLLYLGKKRCAIADSFAVLEENLVDETRTLYYSSSAHYICQRYSLVLEKRKQTSQNRNTLGEDELLAITFTDVESNVLSTIVEKCSDNEFTLITEELSEEMLQCITSADEINATEYQLLLHVLKAVTSASLDRSRMEVLSGIMQKVLMKVHFLMNQTCVSKRCLFYIVRPSMTFISFVLENQKVDLPKQCVIQCIHSCLAVRLNEYVNQPSLFIKVFSLLWQVLNECVIHHTFTFIAARPAFIPCFTMLLKSLVFAGNQDLITKTDASTLQGIELCAQNLDRILTSLAKHEKEFAKVVPYIISEYVDAVQHVTLHPSVKSHIISGINRLFDICGEEYLRLLAINVSHSCREIYNTLVRNYRQYRAAAQV